MKNQCAAMRTAGHRVFVQPLAIPVLTFLCHIWPVCKFPIARTSSTSVAVEIKCLLQICQFVM